MHIYTDTYYMAGVKYVQASTPNRGKTVSIPTDKSLNDCQNASKVAGLLREDLGLEGGRWMPQQTGTDRYTFRDEDDE
jgi:hypothetical protein